MILPDGTQYVDSFVFSDAEREALVSALRYRRSYLMGAMPKWGRWFREQSLKEIRILDRIEDMLLR